MPHHFAESAKAEFARQSANMQIGYLKASDYAFMSTTRKDSFAIGPWTFIERPFHLKDGVFTDFLVHVNIGDEHFATLDGVWPLDVERRQIRRVAAFWVLQEALEILNKATPIAATGIL